MKSFVCGLFALAVALPVSAQTITPNPPCSPWTLPVVACVDAPTDGALVAPDLWFGGWALDVTNGRHTRAITLIAYNQLTHVWTTLPVNVFWGPRPDVQAAFGRRTELATGFTIIPVDPLPLGDYTFTLRFDDQPDFYASAVVRVRLFIQ